MFDIEEYLKKLINLLQSHFGARLLYVGLQGSYMRKEAGKDSDIDVMVVLDSLSRHDLEDYKNILKIAGSYNKSCGFICGKREIENWNPLEICHLLNTTADYFGKLSALTPEYTKDDIKNFVKLSACNLYHALCHDYLFSPNEKSPARLADFYKQVFFILQNIQYLKTGEFILTKKDSAERISGDDRRVMEISRDPEKLKVLGFDAAFDILLNWCANVILEK